VVVIAVAVTVAVACACVYVCFLQAVSPQTRAQNAAEVLKSVGVYHLDPDLADTVLSLRMYK